jgi:hypothetical protein
LLHPELGIDCFFPEISPQFRKIATFQQQFSDIVACIDGTESVDLRSRISVPKKEKGKVDA